jgi:hypothetical protein
MLTRTISPQAAQSKPFQSSTAPFFPPATCYFDTINLFTTVPRRPSYVIAALNAAGVGHAGIDPAFGKYGQQTGWVIFCHQPSEAAMHVLDQAQQKLYGIVSRWDIAADWAGSYEERDERHQWLRAHTVLLHRRRTNSMLIYKLRDHEEEENGLANTVCWIEHRSRKDRSSASTELILYSDRCKLTDQRVNHLEQRNHHLRHPIRVRDLLQINPAEHFKEKIRLLALDVDSLRRKMLRGEQQRIGLDPVFAKPTNFKRMECLLRNLEEADIQSVRDYDPRIPVITIPMSVLQLPSSVSFGVSKSLQGQIFETCRS